MRKQSIMVPHGVKVDGNIMIDVITVNGYKVNDLYTVHRDYDHPDLWHLTLTATGISVSVFSTRYHAVNAAKIFTARYGNGILNMVKQYYATWGYAYTIIDTATYRDFVITVNSLQGRPGGTYRIPAYA